MSNNSLESSDFKNIFQNTILHNPFSDKRFKNRSGEATKLLTNRDKLVEQQIKNLTQEFEINEVKKRNLILEEHKLLLEIELLKKKIHNS